nr:MAG TPA: structural protein [Caudoviricetes sp.]
MTCIEKLKEKFPHRDERDLAAFMDQVYAERAKLEKKIGDIDDLEAKMLERLKGVSDRNMLQVQAAKRAVQLQYAKRMELFNYITTYFKGKEYEALSALLVGTNRNIQGARKSVDASQVALQGYYVGGLIRDLQALGNGDHIKMLNKAIFDKDIARALWSIDNPYAKKFTGPKEAMDIAQVIHKWQEKARDDANRAGAWIQKAPGYIVRQSHDSARISKAGFTTWSEDVSKLVDWNRVDAEDRNAWLKTIYSNLAVGREAGEESNPMSGDFMRSFAGSEARRLSESRVIPFRDADAWFEYNRKYGMRNLREAVVAGLSSSARSTALMRIFGPSPSANVQQLYNMLERSLINSGDVVGEQKLRNERNRIRNQLREVDGTLNRDAVPWLASVGRNLRAWTSMTRLGGALLSSITDAPVFASEFAYQGRPYFTSLLRGITELAHGRGSEEQRAIYSQLGVFFDSMCGDITARFSGDETPGFMTRMQDRFFRLSLLNWWTDSWKRAAGLMMAHDLALEKNLAWNGLKKERQRVLSLYDIGAEEWEVYRQGHTRAADGRQYMTPEVVDDVGDDVIAAYLHRKGQPVTDVRIADTRIELQERLRTYFRDRINFAVLEPDAKTRSMLRQGTSAGTVPGEVLRFATQFKSFPAAYAQKVFGREIYGRQGDDGFAVARSLARLMVMTTLFGYGAMAAKDLVKGKNPRPVDNPKTWLAAFIQGGGAGIFGDFLFGEYNRYGGSLAATLAGPTAGTISDLANIYARIRDGDSFGQAAGRFVMNNIPGNNLWYLRGPLDYLIGYEFFEMMNPGYFNRMKRRVERENEQTFWASPVEW